MSTNPAKTPATSYVVGYDKKILKGFSQRTVDNSAAFLLPYLSPSAKVLDVGCGEGSITVGIAQQCPEGTVIGIDVKAQVIENAAKQYSDVENLSFENADIFELPFDDGEFDVVFAHQVFQHIPKPQAAFNEVMRVTKPNGIVAISVACMSQTLLAPEDELITKCLKMGKQAISLAGGDPDIGGSLPKLAWETGFSNVVSSSSNLFFGNQQERSTFVEMLESLLSNPALKKMLHSVGIESDADADMLKETLAKFKKCQHGFVLIPNVEIVCTV